MNPYRTLPAPPRHMTACPVCGKVVRFIFDKRGVTRYAAHLSSGLTGSCRAPTWRASLERLEKETPRAPAEAGTRGVGRERVD